MDPKVSVILPYYDGQRWLLRTVGSVRRQKVPDWELIIVDDGSSQGPGEILQGMDDARVRLIRIPHSGKWAALNQGVDHALGKMVCFIDQDDIMQPRRLETQLRAFERAPHADGVYSDYERRHEDGGLIDRVINRPVNAKEAIHLMAVGRSPLTMQTIMLKKAFYVELGGFSDRLELTGLDDLEFFVRLFLAQPLMVYAPGVVQSWVLHESNYSRSRDFQEARLHWLARLAELARLHPMLESEMKHYRFHSHCMRGMYFLETGCAGDAVADLFRALCLKPTSLNTCYLLVKSLIQTTAQRLGVNVLAAKTDR